MRRKILSIPWGGLDATDRALGQGPCPAGSKFGPFVDWPGIRAVDEVRSSTSSRVLRVEDEDGTWFLKAYWYRGLRAALRGAFRNTVFAPSRARREQRALLRLEEAGVQPPLEAAIAEHRSFGLLCEARIVTRDFGGADLARRLATAPGDAGLDRDTWSALGSFVRAMHDAGVRDPDLVARNVLARERPDREHRQFEFAKIDASSSWIVAEGRSRFRADEAARRADVDRFARDLERLGAAAPCITAMRTAIDRD